MAQKLAKKNTKVQKIVKKVRPVTTAPAAAHMSQANINLPKGEYTEGVGRNKTATARVRIYKGGGDFVVNGKAVGQYFATVRNAPVLYQKPFEVTDSKNQFAVSAVVEGSGVTAQLRAIMHGLSRALVAFQPDWRTPLKTQGLLTRDDRMKETRKIGTGGKARRKRQSPKR
jgi:small subunit ribosomal protein S9